jgi:hypothetical protein
MVRRSTDIGVSGARRRDAKKTFAVQGLEGCASFLLGKEHATSLVAAGLSGVLLS